MFCGCSSLEKLNISNFKENNLTDLSSIFDNCFSLKELICQNELIKNLFEKINKF